MEQYVTPDSNATLQDLFSRYTLAELKSHAGWRTDLSKRPLSKIPITDFFGSVTRVKLTDSAFPISGMQNSTNLTIEAPKQVITKSLQENNTAQDYFSLSFVPSNTNLFNIPFISTALVFVVVLATISRIVN